MNSFGRLKYLKTLKLEDAAFADLQRFSTEKILFVDDNSIYSKFYLWVLKELKIDCDFASITNLGPDMAGNSDSVLFFPAFEFRITNVNYNRTLEKQYGKPYFVHIHSNRSEAVKRHFEKTFKECICNPLTEFPNILRSYLLNPELMAWLSSASLPLPHNDFFDRGLMQDFLNARKIPYDSPYQVAPEFKSPNLLQWAFQLLPLLRPDNTQFQHYPLHRIYQKYLDTDLNINDFERTIYGDVHL